MQSRKSGCAPPSLRNPPGTHGMETREGTASGLGTFSRVSHSAWRARIAVLAGHTTNGGKSRVGSVNLYALGESRGVIAADRKELTDDVERTSSGFHAGFLRGWFDADGSVQGKQAKSVSVRLASNDLPALYRAQRMLARLGIIATIYPFRRLAGERLLPDGHGGVAVYECKADHELIVACDNLRVFADRVGFSEPDKIAALGLALANYRRKLNRERFVSEVHSVTPAGCEAVYDCTVAENGVHAFDANGVYVHNCGEIILHPDGQFCVAGDTMLITRDGVTSIAGAVGSEVEVWNGSGWAKVRPRKTGSDQRLFRVHFSDGSYLDVTGYHGFSVSNVKTRRTGKGWQRKTTLELMESVSCRWATESFTIEHADGEDVPTEYAYDLGFAVGDGHVRKSNNRVCIDLYGQKQQCPVRGSRNAEYLPKGYNVAKVRTQMLEEIEVATVTAMKQDYEALDPLFAWSRTSILAFFAGLADADGSESGTGGIRIYISDRSRAARAQLLLTKCGVRSSVCLVQKAGTVTNLAIRKRDLYYLQITDCGEIPCVRLDTSRGHTPTMKGKFQTVRRIEALPGRHDTFCFTEPDNHKGVFGNTLTHQCNLSIPICRPDDTEKMLLEKMELAAIFGTIQSTMTYFNYLRPRWAENCNRERLLGVDLLGALDCPLLRETNPDRDNLLERLKTHAVKTNRVWAAKLGINPSVAVTCIKPGGNSGARFATGQSMSGWLTEHMIRNVEVGNLNPMCRFLKDQGVPNETSYRDPGTTVFSFPLAAPAGAMIVSDLITDANNKVVQTKPRRTAIAQLEDYLAFKRHYVEQNVSVTVYVADHEWLEVGAWVYKHWDDICGLAFLPLDGGVYPQAPFTPVTEESFDAFLAKFPAIQWEKLPRYEHGQDHTDVRKEPACAGGACAL